MPDTFKVLSLTAIVILVLTLVFNIMPSWPKFPWDIYIKKGSFRIYIPLITSVVLSVILTLFFNFFKN